MEQLKAFVRRNQVSVLCCLCMLAVMAVMAMFTGSWFTQPNGYASYALQSNAWLQGRLDLGQDYPWLELAIYDGKYYVSFPPFPSYILLPFAVFFGMNTPDGLISLCFTLAGVWAAARLAQRHLRDIREAAFWTMFLFLGTGYLFISLTPAVWFFAQVICFSLCLLSLDAADQGKGGRSLLCWACAVGCRPMVLLFLPVLALILVHRLRKANPGKALLPLLLSRWYWILGPVLLGGSYMVLNWLRFGSILEFGHNYLPEFTRSPEGQFSLSYFLSNFPLLFRLPTVDAQGVWHFAKFDTSLFFMIDPLSIPFLVSVVYAFIRTGEPKKMLRFILPLLILVYICILCAHRTLGGWQFGNRYLKDVLPWLFYGLLLFMPDKAWFRLPARVLMLFGFSLNLIGSVVVFNHWI